MRANICELTVYTQSGAMSFETIATTDNFQNRVAEALEEGTVMLELADGGKLILCAINVVAVEVHEPTTADRIFADTPPAQNI
jgi:hypothetical protein